MGLFDDLVRVVLPTDEDFEFAFNYGYKHGFKNGFLSETKNQETNLRKLKMAVKAAKDIFNELIKSENNTLEQLADELEECEKRLKDSQQNEANKKTVSLEELEESARTGSMGFSSAFKQPSLLQRIISSYMHGSSQGESDAAKKAREIFDKKISDYKNSFSYIIKNFRSDLQDLKNTSKDIKTEISKYGTPVNCGESVKYATYHTITSPMPGTILEIKKRINDPVLAGDVILILEAMKMQNEIMAPADGIITDIAVYPSNRVTAGQYLAKIGVNQNSNQVDNDNNAQYDLLLNENIDKDIDTYIDKFIERYCDNYEDDTCIRHTIVVNGNKYHIELQKCKN